MSKIYEFERRGVLWIYDASLDEVREATQKDIAALQTVANAYGQLKAHVANLTDATELVRQWERSHNPLSPDYRPEVVFTGLMQ